PVGVAKLAPAGELCRQAVRCCRRELSASVRRVAASSSETGLARVVWPGAAADSRHQRLPNFPRKGREMRLPALKGKGETLGKLDGLGDDSRSRGESQQEDCFGPMCEPVRQDLSYGQNAHGSERLFRYLSAKCQTCAYLQQSHLALRPCRR